MNLKKLMWAAAIASAFGLTACSEGDESTLIIEGDTTNNSGGGGGDPGDNGQSTCPEWASSLAQTDDGTDVCRLPQTIMQDRTLTADTIWNMDGRVTVGNGNQEMSATDGILSDGETEVANVTLEIEAGTQIQGQSGTFANLIITRGSMIMAEGTADAPIVFSSSDDDLEGTGEWGGLIIHGYGTHNECTDDAAPCNIDSEGESGFAGGHTPDDNSGVLSYVIVAEGGYEFAVGNEINGISFMSVGSGTTVDHIQVHNNADDGVEFYGGDVSAKYLVLTGAGDDTVDWDEGFQGNLQYVLVRQTAENSAGNAVEADTEGTTAFLSKPTIANATFIGAGENDELIVLKASSGGFFHNSILDIADGNESIVSCVLVDGSGAQANRNTAIVFNNVIADCPAFGDDVLDQTTVYMVDAALDENYASQAAEATLDAPIDWTEVNGVYSESVANPDFLDQTDFLGAVNPDGSDLWFEGWIIEGSL